MRSPVNRRDPSGTRRVERAEIRRERELISAYTDAMARVATGDDPNRAQVLERLSDEMKAAMLESTDQWMQDTSDTTMDVTNRILNNLNTGIQLGNVQPPREEVEMLRMNIRAQIIADGEHTLNTVTRLVTEGYQQGLGADQIRDNIIAEIPSFQDRAERLVRTETMRMCDTFAKARYDAAGCDGYISFPTDDDRLCDHCVSMATGGRGNTLKVYGLDEPMALPWHPNCRCMRLPHFPDQEDIKI